jgi:hypothetical protein
VNREIIVAPMAMLPILPSVVINQSGAPNDGIISSITVSSLPDYQTRLSIGVPGAAGFGVVPQHRSGAGPKKPKAIRFLSSVNWMEVAHSVAHSHTTGSKPRQLPTIAWEEKVPGETIDLLAPKLQQSRHPNRANTLKPVEYASPPYNKRRQLSPHRATLDQILPGTIVRSRESHIMLAANQLKEAYNVNIVSESDVTRAAAVVIQSAVRGVFARRRTARLRQERTYLEEQAKLQAGGFPDTKGAFTQPPWNDSTKTQQPASTVAAAEAPICTSGQAAHTSIDGSEQIHSSRKEQNTIESKSFVTPATEKRLMKENRKHKQYITLMEAKLKQVARDYDEMKDARKEEAQHLATRYSSQISELKAQIDAIRSQMHAEEKAALEKERQEIERARAEKQQQIQLLTAALKQKCPARLAGAHTISSDERMCTSCGQTMQFIMHFILEEQEDLRPQAEQRHEEARRVALEAQQRAVQQRLLEEQR